MLTKFVPLARTVGAAARLQTVRCMGGYAPAHWKTDKQISLEQNSHMNDLPVPQGSWRDNYNQRNAKFNMQLAVSAVALVATVFAMNQCDCFYLHDHPEMKK
eukprot:TRINITY_DN6195_c0_g1_i1.p2 TRINITY_DN6195_c0_g1~~TRINITY_DN6195_c0_g1_i1.p2  ORF type:complete len:102 (-),score=28.26 TRINITY_DN6195_c0_g1_i1:459-764(-)